LKIHPFSEPLIFQYQNKILNENGTIIYILDRNE